MKVRLDDARGRRTTGSPSLSVRRYQHVASESTQSIPIASVAIGSLNYLRRERIFERARAEIDKNRPDFEFLMIFKLSKYPIHNLDTSN